MFRSVIRRSSFRPLKRSLRPSSYSSDVYSREKGIETYWRGHLVKFNYKELYEQNIETHSVFDELDVDEIERQIYHEDIYPDFIHRQNDVVEIDWSDGTISKLNLNNLLEKTDQKFSLIEESCEQEFFDSKEENEALTACYRHLIEDTVATADLKLFDDSIEIFCKKIAARSEPSNYMMDYSSFKKAIPDTYNGLVLVQANHNSRLTFINGRTLTNVYKFLYPDYFKTLVEQPALQYGMSSSTGFSSSNIFGNNDDEGWQTVITVRYDEKDQDSDEGVQKIDQIRFGDLDNNIPCRKFYSAYNEFHRMKNDFIRHVNGTLRVHSDYTNVYDLLNDAVIKVEVKAGECLLVDTTCTWFAHEEYYGEANLPANLSVRQLKMSADHWKSSARSIGLRI